MTIAAGTGVQVVSAEGELDFYTAPRLDALLQSTESEQVILDLTEARFIDSTTLAVVVGAAKRLRKEGRRFSIVSGNTTVARLLQLTGLDRAFEVHPTLVEGVELALARAVEVEAHRQDESAR